jgi:hypothetical protein
MLHSSDHPNYPNSLVTTYLKFCKQDNMEEIIGEDPDTTREYVYGIYWGENWYKEQRSWAAFTVPLHYVQEKLLHTLLNIIYLDKKNTFQMFNLAQNHIQKRRALHCASGADLHCASGADDSPQWKKICYDKEWAERPILKKYEHWHGTGTSYLYQDYDELTNKETIHSTYVM